MGRYRCSRYICCYVRKSCLYLDLPFHSDAEEHDEVHYKYWPEHWHIKGIKKRANHGDDDAFRRRMPAKESFISQNCGTIH